MTKECCISLCAASILALYAGCLTSSAVREDLFFNKDSSRLRHLEWDPISHPIPLVGYSEPYYLTKDRVSTGLWQGNMLQINDDVGPLNINIRIDPSSSKAIADCNIWIESHAHGDSVIPQDTAFRDRTTKWQKINGNDYYLKRKRMSGKWVQDSLYFEADSTYLLFGVSMEEHIRIKAKCWNLDIASDSTYPKVYLTGNLYIYSKSPYPIIGTFILNKKD